MERHQDSKPALVGFGPAAFLVAFVILVRRKGRQGRQGGGYVQIVRSRECRETFGGRELIAGRFQPVEGHAEGER